MKTPEEARYRDNLLCVSEQPRCVKPYILKFNTYINISFSLFISSTDIWAFFTCKPLFWALGDLHWTKHPISVMKIYVSVSLVHGSQLLTTINWCQLQIGTWQEHCQWLNSKGVCHLSLRSLNPVLLHLLPSVPPWGSSGWSEALCGIWWDRSSHSWKFSLSGFMIPILSCPHI